MRVQDFIDIMAVDFYTGVPDSLLQALGNYLMHTYGTNPQHHVIAANEGNAVALAAGYHLATGKVPVVYMQNSGEGNIINPYTSLLHKEVYGIPEIFVIGWRGEPGQKDEPQHIYQGKVTLSLLDDLQIPYFVVHGDTTVKEMRQIRGGFQESLANGSAVAFVVEKSALEYDEKVVYANRYTMRRENAIEHILQFSQGSPIVSTTGKTSRELFEIRERTGTGHKHDFLTVGSMGHSSSIALGLAVQKPTKTIWCIDGDGAALMHLGAMATMGNVHPQNMIHIVLNNEAHESVGGFPTAMKTVDLAALARDCGYAHVASVDNVEDLDKTLRKYQDEKGLRFMEIKCSLGSRKDLGRPTTTAQENKEVFMQCLRDNG